MKIRVQTDSHNTSSQSCTDDRDRDMGSSALVTVLVATVVVAVAGGGASSRGRPQVLVASLGDGGEVDTGILAELDQVVRAGGDELLDLALVLGLPAGPGGHVGGELAGHAVRDPGDLAAREGRPLRLRGDVVDEGVGGRGG
ncbi:unnamed protein product [Clonostachys rosea f. rosea IK726]|uniref:Uncharacterized protein n=1 Tax=Clonostachys rosea f. rosea IK726 TaxID=1349383 RepID=A0ACA9UT40_BIOOC|nr:unnamed protein product [Clonostachys rosea f. rosea IK726]